MLRIAERVLPDGTRKKVQPFHISMEGMESLVLCRDDEDYDAMVKILCVASRRKNVIIIIYAVVSNHCHVAVLAKRQAEAHEYGQEVKRMYSMWLSRKYDVRRALKLVDVKAILLDNDWYVRNALAYVPRNAMDNGCNVNEYRWSGYRAMFCTPEPGRPVSALTKRERRSLMHTDDDLSGVAWLLDADNHLTPSSFCDREYLEQAFEHDQTFFMKTVSGSKAAEMKQKLIDSPRQTMTDTDFLNAANAVSEKWFRYPLTMMPLEKKAGLVLYMYRTTRTSIPQLARIFEMSREKVSQIIGRKAGE